MTNHGETQSNVLLFRQLVESEPGLQAEVASHIGDGSWNPAAIVAIGKARGLDFTAEDLIETMEEEDELSDFELELVAAAGTQQCNDVGA